MEENKFNTEDEKGKGVEEDDDEICSITELSLIALGSIALAAILLWCSIKFGIMCSFFFWLALCSL